VGKILLYRRKINTEEMKISLKSLFFPFLVKQETETTTMNSWYNQKGCGGMHLQSLYLRGRGRRIALNVARSCLKKQTNNNEKTDGPN
jgi:hypothetical protein